MARVAEVRRRGAIFEVCCGRGPGSAASPRLQALLDSEVELQDEAADVEPRGEGRRVCHVDEGNRDGVPGGSEWRRVKQGSSGVREQETWWTTLELCREKRA